MKGTLKQSRIYELADLCGINEVMHKSINELSKGYKQRVGLAHAMMSDPEILVLDEPTSGLDPNQIAEIRSLIKKIGQEKTVILSTHILSEVEATCDRIVIINQGRVVADGTKDVLRAGLSGENVIRLTLTGTDFDQARAYLSSIPGVRSIAMAPVGADLPRESDPVFLQVRSETDVRADLYRQIKKKDWVIMELVREQKSLENVFRELTIAKQTEN